MGEGMQEAADGLTAYVKDRPVMQAAADLVRPLVEKRRLTVKARGGSIPGAVAVANILTENMLRGEARVQSVRVDSEAPAGFGRMISTIEIVLVIC